MLAALESAIGTVLAAASLTIGLHVPWATPAPRVEPDGQVVQTTGEWPAMSVQAVRLWDTRTAWLNLEPRNDTYRFENLDAHLETARRHGVKHVTLVLWGTPRWAARDTSERDAPWLGPGSAAVPADMSDWEDYVRTVATRYAGRIDAYEIGNEPNSDVFYRGTASELADMVSRAAHIIKEADPKATVVSPALVFSDTSDIERGRAFYRALAGTGVDVLALHYYPFGPRAAHLRKVVERLRQVAGQEGMPALPIWVTEVGFRPAGSITLPQTYELVGRTHRAAVKAGVSMLHWYAWSTLPIGDLVPLAPGSQLEAGLHASLDAAGAVKRALDSHAREP